MATLNSNISYGSDEDEDLSGVGGLDPILTWNWATWPHNIRRAAITTGVIVLLLLGAILLGRWVDKDLSKKLQAQASIKAQAQTRLKNSDQERAEIDKNIPLLRQLESQGIFGEEKRLEWIEQLRAIEKRWAGVKLKYDFSIQNPLRDTNEVAGAPTGLTPGQTTAPVLLPSGEPAQSFGVFQTEMKLTLKVLHEGDVLAITEELKAANLGRFTIKKCSFKRPGSGAGNSNASLVGGQSGATTNFVIGAPLDVECLLTWVSMKAYTPS